MIRVAFTGALVDEKVALARALSEALPGPAFPLWVMEPASRAVGGAERADEWPLMWSAARRRVWLNRAGQEAVISPECGLDEVARLGVRLAQLARLRVGAVLGPDGEPVSPDGRLMTAKSLLEVLVEHARAEIEEALTHVLYKPLPPTVTRGNGGGPEPGLAATVDLQTRQILYDSGMPGLDTRLRELPADQGDALEAVRELAPVLSL